MTSLIGFGRSVSGSFNLLTAAKLLLCTCCLFALHGCDASEQEELSTWTQNERDSIKSDVKPLEEPKEFFPQPYSVVGQLEPYATERLASILRGAKDKAMGSSALIEMEEQRRKEPLESFPLDAIVMVGALNRAGKPVALVKVNSLLYQVFEGGYLGQNFGRVMGISETEVVLREIVQDSSGEWIERPAALQLQEETSK